MLFQLGEYLPDLPDHNNTGLLRAENVVADPGGYNPVKDIAATTDAITARCQGGIAAKLEDGVATVFVGDVTKLYFLDGQTFEDISGATYATPAEGRWSFTQYGDRIIAANNVDDVQSFQIGTDTVYSALYSDFTAAYVGIVKDFVVYANTTDTVDGAQEKRVRWTGVGDPTTITPSATTQSDFQGLEGSGVGGAITGFVGGQYGVIFQENSIWRMTYVGSPLVFQFDEVEIGRGTRFPGSIAAFGNLIVYLGNDGFQVFNGTSSTPIGAGKVDKTFIADLDGSNISRMSATIDPVRGLYILSYPSRSNVSGQPDKELIYNFKTQRFTISTIGIEYLFPVFTAGYTLEELDGVDTSLDDLPYSLDSAAWRGGDLIVGAFNATHKFGYLQGDVLTAIIETGDIEFNLNGTTSIDSIRLYVGGTVTSGQIEIGHRFLETDTTTYTDASTTNSVGRYDFRVDDRYLRARITLEGEFEGLNGVDVDTIPGGRR